MSLRIWNGIFGGGFGGGGKVIPFKPDALLYIDGTILNSGGTYYFVNKGSGGSAWNLLITNYDFPTGWSKGFPYKSAATISAPAGATTLIDADVNGFFYTAGTPNQIPVISLFQNIDYANKLFTKHSAQIVDGDGVETYQARVDNIVLYTTVKIGADLSKCNTYYSVPTESLTAKWVDFVNGNDTTGDGTKTLPYKTVAKINTLTLTTNSTVYFKTGVLVTTSAQQFTKNIKYICVGRTEIVTSSTIGAYLTTAGISVQLDGWILNRNSYTGAYAVYCENAVPHILNRCYLGSALYGIRILSNADITANNCIFDVASSVISIGETANNHNITFNSCYQKYYAGLTINAKSNNVQSTNNFTLLNSIFNNTSYLTSGNWLIKGCYFSRAVFETYTGIDHVGNLEISYNSMIPSANNLVLINFNPTLGTNNAQFTVNIHHNRFNDIYASTTCINITEQLDLNIHDNIFYHSTNASSTMRVYANNTLNTSTSAKINNNVIYSEVYCGAIAVGNELTTSANKFTGLVIEKNNIELTNHSNSIHGIAVFRQSDYIMRYNRLKGTGLGAVCKALETESSGGDVYGNILIEVPNALLSKGSNGVKFYNNTVFCSEKINYAFGCIASEYVGSTEVLNCEYKNNIVYDSSPTQGLGDSDKMLYVTALVDAEQLTTWGNVFSNNVIHTVNNSYSIFAATLALAQAAGIEANSISINPNLTVGLWPTIPIEVGEDLGATYDDGLDTTTNFGNATTIPVVVTKQQVEPWQVGVFVQ